MYEDPIQCDKFYHCEDGIATEKLCPDGLVFDPLNRKVNKCDQPFNVDCGNRLELRKLNRTATAIRYALIMEMYLIRIPLLIPNIFTHLLRVYF